MTSKAFVFGGKDANRSAAIIRIRDRKRHAGYTVTINGNPEELPLSEKINRSLLEPYRIYRIKMVPQNKADFVAFNASEKSVTLLPGTVRTLTGVKDHTLWRYHQTQF